LFSMETESPFAMTKPDPRSVVVLDAEYIGRTPYIVSF